MNYFGNFPVDPDQLKQAATIIKANQRQQFDADCQTLQDAGRDNGFFAHPEHSLDSVWDWLTTVAVKSLNDHYVELLQVFAIYRLIYVENHLHVDEFGQFNDGQLQAADIDRLLRKADYCLSDIFGSVDLADYLFLSPAHYSTDHDYHYDQLISLQAMLVNKDQHIPLHPEQEYMIHTEWTNNPLLNNFLLYWVHNLVNAVLKQLPISEKLYLFRAFEDYFYSVSVSSIDFSLFWTLDNYLNTQQMTTTAQQMLDQPLAKGEELSFLTLLQQLNNKYYQRKAQAVQQRLPF